VRSVLAESLGLPAEDVISSAASEEQRRLSRSELRRLLAIWVVAFEVRVAASDAARVRQELAELSDGSREAFAEKVKQAVIAAGGQPSDVFENQLSFDSLDLSGGPDRPAGTGGNPAVIVIILLLLFAAIVGYVVYKLWKKKQQEQSALTNEAQAVGKRDGYDFEEPQVQPAGSPRKEEWSSDSQPPLPAPELPPPVEPASPGAWSKGRRERGDEDLPPEFRVVADEDLPPEFRVIDDDLPPEFRVIEDGGAAAPPGPTPSPITARTFPIEAAAAQETTVAPDTPAVQESFESDPGPATDAVRQAATSSPIPTADAFREAEESSLRPDVASSQDPAESSTMPAADNGFRESAASSSMPTESYGRESAASGSMPQAPAFQEPAVSSSATPASKTGYAQQGFSASSSGPENLASVMPAAGGATYAATSSRSAWSASPAAPASEATSPGALPQTFGRSAGFFAQRRGPNARLSSSEWTASWTWTSRIASSLGPVQQKQYSLMFHAGRFQGHGTDPGGSFRVTGGVYDEAKNKLKWREVPVKGHVEGGMLLDCDGKLQRLSEEDSYNIVGSFTAVDTSLSARRLGHGRFVLTAGNEQTTGNGPKMDRV